MTTRLRRTLESLYARYHVPAYLGTDPLSCVRRFKGTGQVEIVGLLASSLAYGRVGQIISSIEEVLSLTSQDPLGLACSGTFPEKRHCLRSFRHRFSDGTDIALLLEAAGRAIRERGSLGNLYAAALAQAGGQAARAGGIFVDTLRAAAAKAPETGPTALKFLLPSPLDGSACKRLNMYFRWMIRPDDGIDLGVWSGISPRVLVVPLDVHVFRAGGRLGLTKRKTADWKAAMEITAELGKIDPDDPVRFDFSLCRYGMLGKGWGRGVRG